MVVIGIVGAFSQKRKKPEANRQAETFPKNEIWDIFQEETFFRKPEVVENKFEEWEPEPGPAVNEQNYDFDAKSEGGSAIISETPKSEPVKVAVRKKVDFSLRKAVIYSEILNRKYV